MLRDQIGAWLSPNRSANNCVHSKGNLPGHLEDLNCVKGDDERAEQFASAPVVRKTHTQRMIKSSVEGMQEQHCTVPVPWIQSPPDTDQSQVLSIGFTWLFLGVDVPPLYND